MYMEKCEIIEKVKSFLYHEGICQVEVAMQRGQTTAEVGSELINKLNGKFAGITHDLYGAPYTLSEKSEETTHISLTDEKEYTAGIAVVSNETSAFMGVGVDIASISSFSKDNPAFEKRFFHSKELEYLAGIEEKNRPFTKAILFSIKEAALKSMADAIRPFTVGQEDGFDYVEFQQFEVSIKEGMRADVIPKQHAADASKEVGIQKYEAVYFIYGQYIISIVKSMGGSNL